MFIIIKNKKKLLLIFYLQLKFKIINYHLLLFFEEKVILLYLFPTLKGLFVLSYFILKDIAFFLYLIFYFTLISLPFFEPPKLLLIFFKRVFLYK